MYGSTVHKPAKEGDPINATSPYAVSKLATDLHLNSMFRVTKFPMNIIRPSNCYGPGQYVYRIIPKAILYMLSGKPFPLEGGGTAEKSFLYVEDLAEAIDLICDKGTVGETYNVGTEKPVSMKEIVFEICRQLGKDEREFVNIAPGRVGEDSRYWIDSTKVKEELGWEPKTSLQEGIRHMIEWCKKYQDDLMQDPDYFVLRA
jgi:dTDP-glucose 4,6-dehydratase